MAESVYTVEHYRLLTAHVAQVFLSSVTPLHYTAGQYLKIIHPDDSASPFSIANAPLDSALIELHLLFLKENSRALEIQRRLQEEKQLRVRGPYGQCTVNILAPQCPLIFLARGTGFAPIKAIIEALQQQSNYPPMHLYWSVPGWRDLYLQELVAHWVKTLPGFQFTAILTREFLPSPEVKFGPLPPIVLKDYPDLSAHQVYASGPQEMVYAALADFQRHGLRKERFYSDVFDYAP